MKSVPAANTKSAPMTESTAAGKPKAQYVVDGLISAKRRLAVLVSVVPDTKRCQCYSQSIDEDDAPMKYMKGTRPATDATMKLQIKPETFWGKRRTTVRIGVRPS